jgi:hypothetical protein
LIPTFEPTQQYISHRPPARSLELDELVICLLYPHDELLIFNLQLMKVDVLQVVAWGIVLKVNDMIMKIPC